ARAVHMGLYAELHRAYSKLDAWCSQHALRVQGESWEIYGDWTDDPSALRTDVFLRICDG
ncbi:MAG: hypothetical protein KDA75_01205, partial [Planctomycetaceae bacterium]|nr:hypothetical protein [Planctomycetaceae bacterium]